jgi:hypothetical protein
MLLTSSDPLDFCQEVRMRRNGIPHSFSLVALVGAAAFLCAAPSGADPDRSPRPGGVYLLKPGIFVAKRASCTKPPRGAIRFYDGKGINPFPPRGCVARVISKKRSGYGSLYVVRQSCTMGGTSFVERQVLDIPDALNFTVRSEGNAAYRYCPIHELPERLRPFSQGK